MRRATGDDATALGTIHLAAWRAAYRGLVPDAYLSDLSLTRTVKWLREFLSSAPDDSETYVLERDVRAVGFLTLGPCRDADLEVAVGEIWGIYLAPDCWRQGIGGEACRQAERILLSRGFRHAVLWVFEGNDAARRFYETMGYHADGAAKTIDVRASLPAVRYRKELLPISD